IVVLHVLAELDRYFSGEDLRAKFSAYNLLYGPMHIYHKYENADGSGTILFSVANAFEPGTLNLEYPESFYTRGLTFFMQTSNKTNPSFAFETMLGTATALAKAFNAKLCDQQRLPLTVTTAQDYRNQVQGTR
ncbi:MAG TPA: cell division protein ZipA C-terminal FtsZ-binding domain-containing protein, partial [Gammaproteobacteria bacterium]|nr:cell division protein ZipA C-terminal FtsZ-binding domain-containing protein [Gammaproteobacteria bacterium]